MAREVRVLRGRRRLLAKKALYVLEQLVNDAAKYPSTPIVSAAQYGANLATVQQQITFILNATKPR